ncbi:MAG: prevent-host-death protein [Betaproteobacteria bacterium]|nr:prevent-host-death protein [Betaproteobacteria bacterium]
MLVTDRDRIIAELVPPRAERSTLVADARLAEAVRQGWLTPPVFVSTEPPPRLPIAPTRELLDELTRDRDAR